jgi:hypothetical protein
MRVAFGKKLSGIQRASLLDNAVHEEVLFAPEQDDVPAAHVLNRNLPNQGDILRPHPRLHAGTVNTQGNPATQFQHIRDVPHIVRAAFPADPIRFLPEFSSIRHQTLPLNSIRRVPKFSSFSEMRERARAEIWALLFLARPELEQIR